MFQHPESKPKKSTGIGARSAVERGPIAVSHSFHTNMSNHPLLSGVFGSSTIRTKYLRERQNIAGGPKAHGQHQPAGPSQPLTTRLLTHLFSPPLKPCNNQLQAAQCVAGEAEVGAWLIHYGVMAALV
jgi:hypothetical protein